MSSNSTHPAFTHLRSHNIQTLNLSIDEYEHLKTGAKHFHLAMSHPENVFMVALRTVPVDSCGVAHILEHTALCGSEKYPVRDPFFLMIRRSLNTFMNALTSSDYTAYPFASQNDKDFNNLLDIYLDAVFFARLDKLDFAQEGHRLEFDDPTDASSDLVYRGVVYNEMKGATSSVVSVLYNAVKKHLFPTTTYHYNSGGDPAHIPDLTYAQLIDFYQSHYHPSNAVFMTFGKMSAFDLQSRFEDRALHRFEEADIKIEAGCERRYTETLRVEEPYVADSLDATQKKTHVVLAWLLGDNTDLELLLKSNLLSDVLLDTSASPLRHALEQTSLGAAPSPLCGLEETNREVSFMCGLEGADRADADDIEALILSTLQDLADNGVAASKLAACLHQLELNRREIGGDGCPYGLQLIFSCLPAAIHRGNPIDLLDIDPVLERLRQAIQAPDFLRRLVKELLLDNPHRIRLSLYPDETLGDKIVEVEKSKLADIKSAMSKDDRSAIIKQAEDLRVRQNCAEPLDVLPKVGIEDIPLNINYVTGQTETLASHLVTRYAAGSNGLVYHQIVTPLPKLTAHQLQLLPLYAQLVTELGSAGRSYLDTQHLQHSLTGGINAYISTRGNLGDPDTVAANLTISGSSLAANAASMIRLVKDTLQRPGFDDAGRIRDLIRQFRIRRENSVSDSGHTLAMSAAASFFRPVAKLNHHLSGLSGIMALQKLDNSLDDAKTLNRFIHAFQKISAALQQMPPHLLLITDQPDLTRCLGLLADIWSGGQSYIAQSLLDQSFARVPQDQAWVITTQVNFCASAYKTVPENHPDSAPLNVLGGVLRNGYLHRVIREQGGAYGGGAGHDGANGVFRFYSYRDPNLMATFDAFDASVNWLLNSDISFEMVEEAILGIISTMDAPASPAGEAKQAFHGERFGRDSAHRKSMRASILNVTADDIKRVAGLYLRGTCARAAVISQKSAAQLPKSFAVQQI